MAPAASSRRQPSICEQAEALFLNIADISCVMISVVGIVITGGALYRLVPRTLFWTVSGVNVLGGPLGVALSYGWTRRKRWCTGFKVVITFLFSTLLTAMIGCGLLLATAYRSGQLKQSQLGQAVLSETLMAVSICFAVSLLLRTDVPEMLWRLLKGLRRSEPRCFVCDDLEAAAPGTCAICLDKLCELDPEIAKKPSKGAPMFGAGLLRLPCGHTFHGTCAENWFLRNETCPMCRDKRCELKLCTRICLRSGCLQEQAHLRDEGDAIRTIAVQVLRTPPNDTVEVAI